jgi:hypothetical protein
MMMSETDLRYTAVHEAGHFFVGLWYHVITDLVGLPKSVIYNPPTIEGDLIISGETTYNAWCYEDSELMNLVKFNSCLAGFVAVKVIYPNVSYDEIAKGADVDLAICYDMMQEYNIDIKESYIYDYILMVVYKDHIESITNELIANKQIDTNGTVGSSIMCAIKNDSVAISKQIREIRVIANDLFRMA